MGSAEQKDIRFDTNNARFDPEVQSISYRENSTRYDCPYGFRFLMPRPAAPSKGAELYGPLTDRITAFTENMANSTS